MRRGADNIASSASAAPAELDIPRLVEWSDGAARAARAGEALPAMPRLRRSTPLTRS